MNLLLVVLVAIAMGFFEEKVRHCQHYGRVVIQAGPAVEIVSPDNTKKMVRMGASPIDNGFVIQEKSRNQKKFSFCVKYHNTIARFGFLVSPAYGDDQYCVFEAETTDIGGGLTTLTIRPFKSQKVACTIAEGAETEKYQQVFFITMVAQ